MNTMIYIIIGISVLAKMVRRLVCFLWNTYMMCLLKKLSLVLKKWPEDIKVPLVIASIEKE